MESTERPEFNLICRLCIRLLETEKVSPIFNNEKYSARVSLPERIRYCASIEVFEGDGLPNKICSNCLLKLNQSFVFRNQCVLANNTLQKLIQDVTLDVSEISHFLDFDIEDKVVEVEESSTVDKRHSCRQRKKGRSKRNTIKSRDKCVRKGRNCDSETYEKDSNSEEERKIKSRRLKLRGKEMCEVEGEETDSKGEINLIHESNSEGYRERKSKKKKSLEEEILVKEKEIGDAQSGIEDFTVEPDVFGLGMSKNEPDADTSRNEKSYRPRRARPRKSLSLKEKPSSYTCGHCHKVYPSEGGWRYHIRTMHSENYQPFICDLCGKAFKVKKNLETHKNAIHYHLKDHLCDLCGRGFATKYALKVHKIWHNDEKNFPCDVCGTRFRTRGKMNTHRMIHGGPKKFMCHVCSKDFRWKKDFEIHMRMHTGEKPFNCSHCGKAFSSLTNMKKHERNHVTKTSPESFFGEVTVVPQTSPLFEDELPFHFIAGRRLSEIGSSPVLLTN